VKIKLDCIRYAALVHGCLLLVFLLAAAERELKAYADPGTGSLIWQVLVAGVIGVMYYIRKAAAYLRGRHKAN
jgi:uncharacterized membrane protein YdcZ (DUF606 family)